MTTLVPTLILASVLVVPTEGESTLPEVNVEGIQQYIPLENVSKVPEVTLPQCIPVRDVPLNSLLLSMNMGNGLEAFLFSTIGKKQPDYEMLIPEGDENRYPLFYRVDLNFDGFIDIAYVDDKRDGSCDGLRIYWLPKKKSEQPPTNRHQGDPIPEGESCEGMPGKEA